MTLLAVTPVRSKLYWMVELPMLASQTPREPLTQNDRAAKYVCGLLVEAWNLLFPCERRRIVKLLIERIDLSVDGFAVKWRDLPRCEFVSECSQFGIFDQRLSHQPDPDPDPVVQSLISWVPLPPGLRTRRKAKPSKPGKPD